ncbi:MAG: CoA ester lyase [bacterium]|nr:CoA ester lyase [bacterium]
MHPHKARRALLFMPGSDRHKIEKGATLGVDTVIVDLEDGVALNQKAAARETTAAALREVHFGHTERLVRINPILESGLYRDDLDATIEAHPDGYVLPKVESAAHVQQVADVLTRAERTYGWLDGSIRLFAIIESARGVVHLNEIAGSSPRLAGLIFGAEDLAGDLGAVRTPDGWEVYYARSAVVLHAKAYGLAAIDTPHVDLSPEQSQLLAETEQALYMGYTGKLAIHPRQVPIIQQVFTPNDEQIQQARALIAAHDARQSEGVGVFEYEGRMVDQPMIRAAESVLAQARAAGLEF